jgi:hypothetical protein
MIDIIDIFRKALVTGKVTPSPVAGFAAKVRKFSRNESVRRHTGVVGHFIVMVGTLSACRACMKKHMPPGLVHILYGNFESVGCVNTRRDNGKGFWNEFQIK